MTFYREDPEPRIADQRVAAIDGTCAECSMPIKCGDPITLMWFGWVHSVQCGTKVSL